MEAMFSPETSVAMHHATVYHNEDYHNPNIQNGAVSVLNYAPCYEDFCGRRYSSTPRQFNPREELPVPTESGSYAENILCLWRK
jgi:hypothetical protein